MANLLHAQSPGEFTRSDVFAVKEGASGSAADLRICLEKNQEQEN